MYEDLYWRDSHMPEMSIEPPRDSDPECWCDECVWCNIEEDGSRSCDVFERKIKDVAEAINCTSFKGAWLL